MPRGDLCVYTERLGDIQPGVQTCIAKEKLFIIIIIIIYFFNALGSKGSRGLKAKQKKMIKLLG